MDDKHDEINLDSLPPDIIRLIIRMEPHSSLNMRLISHLWNDLVLEFRPLASRRFALERVNFYPGDPNHAVKEGKHIQMRAIVPEKIGKNTGLRDWLTVGRRYNDSSFEVESLPHRISPFEGRFVLPILLAIASSLAAFFPNLIHSSDLLIAFPFLSMMTAVFILIFFAAVGMAAKRWIDRLPHTATRDTFANFVSHFSRIETLQMKSFTEFTDSEGAIVLESMRGMKINRLEIWEERLDGQARKRILELCRANGIEGVFIAVTGLEEEDDICNFVIQLCDIGVKIVDVYEKDYTKSIQINWMPIWREMNENQIILVYRNIHNPLFDEAAYAPYATAHYHFMKSEDDRIALFLAPLNLPTGFDSIDD